MQPDQRASSWLKKSLFRAHVLKEIFLYRTSPGSLASRKALVQLRDSSRGRRCFVIGNGPSLKRTDLGLLRNEFTFGLNRIYLLFPELGFATTYLVSVNRLVIQQCIAEILAQPSRKFLPWGLRGSLGGLHPADVTFIQADTLRPGFYGDVGGGLWQGSTVTYVALQLAFHMGFEQAVLVGVDHSFAASGRPNAEVVSSGDDPNHFSPVYFGTGFRWQLPDLEASEFAYGLARRAFEQAGRQIIDATIGGKLTVFPKVEYASLFR